MKTQPYVQPIRAPFEEVFVAYEDGDVFIYKPRQYEPDSMTRLCLPADHPKLLHFNPKRSKDLGNPWGATSVGDGTLIGRVAQLLINEGTNVLIWRGNYSWRATKLFGAQGANNWSLDKANKKFSFEFYLDNDREESNPALTDGQSDADERCIYDDDEGFWGSVTGGGAGSLGPPILSEELTEIKKGISSLKVEATSGTKEFSVVSHGYTTPQDFSGYDFICVYVYGINNGGKIRVALKDTANVWRYWDLIDNWTGWQRVVLPLRNPTAGADNDLSNIDKVDVAFGSLGTRYIDRMVLDVGQWAKIEVYVPDVLSPATSWGVSSWTGTGWASFLRVKGSGEIHEFMSGDLLYFLDGTKQSEIFGATNLGIGSYKIGKRYEEKARIAGDAPSTIIYSSYYGCKKRIGFAIKMPPDDGQDSATSGISQCKLKMEVYYEGDLTVEDTWGDNHGTRYGAQPVTGKVGMALDFDGKDDHVEVPDSPSLNFDLPESFSLEAWFKLSSLPTTSWYAILSKYGAGQGAGYNDLFALYIDTDGKIRFSVRDSAGNNPVAIGSTLAIDTWYHVVGVRDVGENEIRLYLNGVLDATPVTDTTVDDISSPRPFLIGNQEHYVAGQPPTLPFHGIIDEVRIYNRALSATEVQDLYNGKRITDGLVSEWAFEDDPRFGQTTYEFEDSTNQYYGLRNINDSWLALFNPTKNLLEYLVLNRRPLGLEVIADHNEDIREIKFKLKKGTRIWLGELVHGDHDRATDGDGVPDIFEEVYDPSIVLDIDFNNEDETQNIAHDRSPNHNNGTIYGAKWVNGKVGRALDFDGVDDYTDVPDSTSLRLGTGDHTIEGWFKTTATSGMIFAKGINYKQECIWIRLYAGKLQLKWWDDPDPSREILSGLVNDGEWHHFVAQRSGNTVYGFLDGNQFGSSVIGADAKFDAIGYVNRIGAENTAGGQPFNGIIDEVRIYNRGLTADEIKERYNLGKLKRVSVPRLVKRMGYAGW